MEEGQPPLQSGSSGLVELESTRVLLVTADDGLEQHLREEIEAPPGNGYSIYRVSTREEAIGIAEALSHDVHLIDDRVGADDGFELLADLVRQRPHTPCVFLKSRTVRSVLLRALRMGASEVISREALAPGVLLGALRIALERMHRESHIAHIKTVEAIRSLSRSFGNDLNNALQGILGRVEILSADGGLESQSWTSVKEIEEIVDRARRMVSRLLAVGETRGGRPIPIQVAPFLREGLAVIMNEVRRPLDITLDIPEGLPGILGDAQQLGQMMTGLIYNAIEAYLHGTPQIRIVARKVPDGEVIPPLGWIGKLDRDGSLLRIDVRDNGLGMDEDTRWKAFTPFFSTKPRRRGLGLSTALGVVRAHNGAIRLESLLGAGTIVSILLPAAPPEQAVPEPPARDVVDILLEEGPRSPVPPTAGSGTDTTPVIGAETGPSRVLLIDDEPVVLDVTRRILESQGIECLTAKSGQEGLEVFEDRMDEIALVVMDIDLSDTNGILLCRQLQKLRQGTRVLFISGFSAHSMSLARREPGFSGYIQKPYHHKELVVTIHDILQGRS